MLQNYIYKLSVSVPVLASMLEVNVLVSVVSAPLL